MRAAMRCFRCRHSLKVTLNDAIDIGALCQGVKNTPEVRLMCRPDTKALILAGPDSPSRTRHEPDGGIDGRYLYAFSELTRTW
jgi:hypothetical protein